MGFFGFLGCLLLLVFLQGFSKDSFLVSIFKTLLILGLGFVFFLLLGGMLNSLKREPSKYEKETMDKCKEVIKKHAPELIAKRRQLIKDKGYGVKDDTEWQKEKIFFIDQVVRKKVVTFMISTNELLPLIDSTLREETPGLLSNLSRPEHGNPIAFENYCAGILEKHGWTVVTTKASGDQGADVIASKNGKKIVLQCKQYRGAVGNAAVQEVYSAMSHYGAQQAAVVTESKYTQAARSLASSTGVLLLGPEDLANLS